MVTFVEEVEKRLAGQSELEAFQTAISKLTFPDNAIYALDVLYELRNIPYRSSPDFREYERTGMWKGRKWDCSQIKP
jgi:hypothetical protein